MKKKKTKVLIAMLVMIVSILEFSQTVQAAKQKIFYKKTENRKTNKNQNE